MLSVYVASRAEYCEVSLTVQHAESGWALSRVVSNFLLSDSNDSNGQCWPTRWTEWMGIAFLEKVEFCHGVTTQLKRVRSPHK